MAFLGKLLGKDNAGAPTVEEVLLHYLMDQQHRVGNGETTTAFLLEQYGDCFPGAGLEDFQQMRKNLERYAINEVEYRGLALDLPLEKRLHVLVRAAVYCRTETIPMRERRRFAESCTAKLFAAAETETFTAYLEDVCREYLAAVKACVSAQKPDYVDFGIIANLLTVRQEPPTSKYYDDPAYMARRDGGRYVVLFIRQNGVVSPCYKVYADLWGVTEADAWVRAKRNDTRVTDDTTYAALYDVAIAVKRPPLAEPAPEEKKGGILTRLIKPVVPEREAESAPREEPGTETLPAEAVAEEPVVSVAPVAPPSAEPARVIPFVAPEPAPVDVIGENEVLVDDGFYWTLPAGCSFYARKDGGAVEGPNTSIAVERLPDAEAAQIEFLDAAPERRAVVLAEGDDLFVGAQLGMMSLGVSRYAVCWGLLVSEGRAYQFATPVADLREEGEIEARYAAFREALTPMRSKTMVAAALKAARMVGAVPSTDENGRAIVTFDGAFSLVLPQGFVCDKTDCQDDRLCAIGQEGEDACRILVFRQKEPLSRAEMAARYRTRAEGNARNTLFADADGLTIGYAIQTISLKFLGLSESSVFVQGAILAGEDGYAFTLAQSGDGLDEETHVKLQWLLSSATLVDAPAPAPRKFGPFHSAEGISFAALEDMKVYDDPAILGRGEEARRQLLEGLRERLGDAAGLIDDARLIKGLEAKKPLLFAMTPRDSREALKPGDDLWAKARRGLALTKVTDNPEAGEGVEIFSETGADGRKLLMFARPLNQEGYSSFTVLLQKADGARYALAARDYEWVDGRAFFAFARELCAHVYFGTVPLAGLDLPRDEEAMHKLMREAVDKALSQLSESGAALDQNMLTASIEQMVRQAIQKG